MLNWTVGLLLSLPLAAQTLTLSCPPMKPNKPTVCPITLMGSGIVDLQWNLTAVPPVAMTVQAVSANKSIVSNGSIYMLTSMNATPIVGKIATVTIPGQMPHTPGPILTLSNAIGVDAAGHAVTVAAAISVQVQ